MRIENRAGGYAFLKGIDPYSAGVTALPGFEIVHARLERDVPLQRGFAAIESYLRSERRPRQALCAVELRSTRPFTFQGFRDFNQRYVSILKEWGLLIDGVNPVARTNVAPHVLPPAEPSVHGFSITIAAENAPPSFVVAGAGELPEGSLDPHDVVRRGEISTDALREKARFVMGLMSSRLAGLGANWKQVTATQVYTVHDIHPLLETEILGAMGEAARLGIHWHYARPPIESIEYEMDLRGCRREVICSINSRMENS
jgi:hypothetical protein